MNKVKPVMLCCLCESINHECDHEPELHYRNYQCQLCLHIHSLNSDAQRCCMDLTSKAVITEEHRQPLKKRVAKESEIYPTMAMRRGRRN